MTKEERKAKYKEVYEEYKAKAKEASVHAQKAKDEYRKSDYLFWMNMYECAVDRAERFFIEYINA